MLKFNHVLMIILSTAVCEIFKFAGILLLALKYANSPQHVHVFFYFSFPSK